MDIPEKYKQLWWCWDVRVLILLSISIQITLTFLGRLRKKNCLRWIQKALWGSYFIADLVANFILSQLSNVMDDSSSSNAIVAFWAPFFILHLGGPDIITAYSMEDNELWARHLLSLGYELIIAFYVLFRSLPNTRLLTPTLLIFLVAIIKYLERSYSLYKASAKGFRCSISSSSRKLPIEDMNALNQAFYLYSSCKPFFINLIPHLDFYAETRHLIKEMSTEEVLRVMRMELSYAYDELYTKAVINHSRVGYALRVLCTICVFLSFYLFLKVPKDGSGKFDVTITYILLVTSICLDVAATILLVFSDWMVVSLLSVKKLSNWSILLVKHIIRIKILWSKTNYWLIEMPQLNLLNNCLKIFAPNKTLCQRIMDWIFKKLFFKHETKSYIGWRTTVNEIFTLQMHQSAHATEEIMKIIISYVQKCLLEVSADWVVPGHAQLLKFNKLIGFSTLSQVSDWDIPRFVKLLDELSLDQQVFIWHVATELCFNWNPKSLNPLYPHQREMEDEEGISSVTRKCPKIKACKYMSNYMIYLVLMRSKMMSTMVRASPVLLYRALDDMVQLIRSYKMQNVEVEEVCRKILTTPVVWSSDKKSLFIIARVLSYQMLLIKEEERWKVLTTIWVELLMQAAKNSRAIIHVKELSNGGELLTFIWLLNKHMEIDDIFDIIVDIPRN